MKNVHPYLIPAFDVYEINKQLAEYTTPDAIKYQVAKYYSKKAIIKLLYGDVTASDMKDLILSKTRKQEIIRPRYATIYFLRNILNLKLATIGKVIGFRDHSTIIHALKSYEDICEFDKVCFEDHVNLCSVFKVPNRIQFFK
jgi:chromosomal replication initiation ATPase DnaA